MLLLWLDERIEVHPGPRFELQEAVAPPGRHRPTPWRRPPRASGFVNWASVASGLESLLGGGRAYYATHAPPTSYSDRTLRIPKLAAHVVQSPAQVQRMGLMFEMGLSGEEKLKRHMSKCGNVFLFKKLCRKKKSRTTRASAVTCVGDGVYRVPALHVPKCRERWLREPQKK